MSALRWVAIVVAVLALIMVPFALFGERVDAGAAAWLAGVAGHPMTAFAGIALLLAADIVLPVPSSLVSTAAGAILGFGWGALASFTGMTIGCAGGYAVGRAFGHGVVGRFVSQDDLSRAEDLARRHGDWMIVTTRAVPILAEASTIFAGVAVIPVMRFLLVASLANLGISLAYTFVGAFAAETRSFLLAVAGALLLPLAARAVVPQRLARPRGTTTQ